MTSNPISWDKIGHLLNRMGTSLEELSQLLLEEEVVMKTLDREKIDDLLVNKERVLEELSGLEHEVLSTVRPWISSKTGMDWWSWIKHEQTARTHGLGQLLTTVEMTAQRIREQGRRNADLVRRGQHVVGEAVNLVLSGLGHVSVYQGTGTLRVHSVPGSVNLRG